jgi:xylulokinase
MAFYVGFDSSTQSLTATVIEAGDGERRVILDATIVFDDALPGYRTRHGVVTSDGRTVTAPPGMWAEALDLMMGQLRDAGLDLRRIRAISGAAQQHGSVYLTAAAAPILSDLNPQLALARQLDGAFSRAMSPVWLDCSTGVECRALTDAVGGDAALARLSGSRAYERFTAAQIRKFAVGDAPAYAQTARIHLVSSFMASLLCGADAPVEPGDASGMNLMNLETHEWAPAALAATAPDLLRRLPPIRPSWTIAGVLSPYWQHRYGFPPARIVSWSGDNPSSLVGLGLIAEGQLGISLGTSDTVFAPRTAPSTDPHGAGHVFGSPAGGYMALTCFANGSLARERIRARYGLDWPAFSSHLSATPPGNGGGLLVPWFVPEITPGISRPGPHRYALGPEDAAANVRAVVEGQALSMRLFSTWFAPEVGAIRATGGAAANREILQVLADVFDAPVVRIAPRNAAALGAALRAFHADRLAAGESVPWPEVVAGFTDPAPDGEIRPRPAAVAVYAGVLPRYAQAIAALLNG